MGVKNCCEDENCIWKRKLNSPEYNRLGFKRRKWLALPDAFKTRREYDGDFIFYPSRKVAECKNIMKTIFAFMTKPDLLNCRLVSKRWSKLSSETLQDCTIFEFRELHFRSPAVWKTLDNLIPILKNSKRFPCNQFRFYTTGKLLAGGRYEQLLSDEYQVFNKFLDVYGTRIKKLTVDVKCAKKDLYDFAQSPVYSILREIVRKIPNRISGCVSLILSRGEDGDAKVKLDEWGVEEKE